LRVFDNEDPLSGQTNIFTKGKKTPQSVPTLIFLPNLLQLPNGGQLQTQREIVLKLN
jgi:hypothetical protein